MKAYIITFLLLFSLTTKTFSQDTPEVRIGGALRFGYNLSLWKESQQKRGGDFGYESFILNTVSAYKGITLNAEYRFLSESNGGSILKHGWFEHNLTPQAKLQLGLAKVPWDITGYNSHNFFFSLNYYVGLEDDYDMGVVYAHKSEKIEYDIAFFKNAEDLSFGDRSDVSPSRYSVDASSIDLDGDGIMEHRNKEVNTGNIRIVKPLGKHHTIGMTGQFGALQNLDTDKMGTTAAYSFQYLFNKKGWNFRAQVAGYKYDPQAPFGESDDVIAMGSFGGSFLVASEAQIYSTGIAYTLRLKKGLVQSIQFYNDFSMIDKSNSNFSDTYFNATGMLISMGKIYTYVDWFMGKNHPYLGPGYTNGLAAGDPNAHWENRFNINIGYYF